MSRVRAVVILIVVLVLWASLAFAQESLDTAKGLYASAAYDDALSVLTRLRASQPRPEVDLYRVLCLVALGRQTEAEDAVQAVVKANPTFVPDVDTSPRIRELFARTRKQLVPDIVRRMYLEAKAALQRKDREAALSGFDGLVRLIDSVDDASDESLPELRLLAAGFLDLTRALPDPAIELRKPANTEAPKATRPPEIVPPVAIRQAMPLWVPSDTMSRQGSFTGAVRVSISAAGRVETATIDRSVHPAYDPLLLQAARLWEYQPARSDGIPVSSEQVVQVQLKPRQ